MGGMEGFGPVDPTEDGRAFHADWEARVFALNTALIRRQAYTLDEFRDAIEHLAPERYLASSYYERWLEALEGLAVKKGLVAPGDLEEEGGDAPGPGPRGSGEGRGR